MNRFVGFTLIGSFLAIGATASGSGASQVAHDRNAYLSVPMVQQSVASAVEALPAPAATLAPASVTRIINASQPAARPALAPAAAEAAPATQASPGACPPARTDIACRQP